LRDGIGTTEIREISALNEIIGAMVGIVTGEISGRRTKRGCIDGLIDMKRKTRGTDDRIEKGTALQRGRQ